MESDQKKSSSCLSVCFFILYFCYFVTYAYELLFIFSAPILYALFCFLLATSMFSVLCSSFSCLIISLILMIILQTQEVYFYVNVLMKYLPLEISFRAFYLLRLILAILFSVVFILYINHHKALKKEQLEELQAENNKRDIQIKILKKQERQKKQTLPPPPPPQQQQQQQQQPPFTKLKPVPIVYVQQQMPAEHYSQPNSNNIMNANNLPNSNYMITLNNPMSNPINNPINNPMNNPMNTNVASFNNRNLVNTVSPNTSPLPTVYPNVENMYQGGPVQGYISPSGYQYQSPDSFRNKINYFENEVSGGRTNQMPPKRN